MIGRGNRKINHYKREKPKCNTRRTYGRYTSRIRDGRFVA